jgi:hypothetical protein
LAGESEEEEGDATSTMEGRRNVEQIGKHHAPDAADQSGPRLRRICWRRLRLRLRAAAGITSSEVTVIAQQRMVTATVRSGR